MKRQGESDDATQFDPLSEFDANTTARVDDETEQDEPKPVSLDGTTRVEKPLDVGVDGTTQVAKPLDEDGSTTVAKPLERPSAELTPISPLGITPTDLHQRALAATAPATDDDILTGTMEKLRRVTLETPYAGMSTIEPEIAIGTMLGDYRVTGKIAQGGFGIVLSAVHPKIGKRAAIKVLKKQLCKDPDTLQRFIDEARVVNQIRHPNIVDVFAFGETRDGRSYLAMEWLDGNTLRARIARGRLELGEICELMRPLLRALMAAHVKNIVHRDLKPDNIFLVDVPGEPPFVKLLDFGIAKLLHDDVRVSLTASGALLGTPLYMAPEQGRSGAIDKAADVYALGVILFEMVTGQPPFTGETALEVVAKHLVEKPARPSSLVSLPRKLEDLILAMLEKDASYRPRLDSVAEIIEGLRERTSAKPESDSFTSEAPTDQPAIPRARTDPSRLRGDPSHSRSAPRTPVSGVRKLPRTPQPSAHTPARRRREAIPMPSMPWWLLVAALAIIAFILAAIVLH